jgi:hypothetical protein
MGVRFIIFVLLVQLVLAIGVSRWAKKPAWLVFAALFFCSIVVLLFSKNF